MKENVNNMEYNSVIKEEILRRIIREEITVYLNEMAISKSVYIDKFSNILPQIVINWCLIHYCTLSGDKIELKNHWRSELRSYLNLISSYKIKNGNNINTKENSLYKCISDFEIDRDEKVIDSWIQSKFDEEGIDTYGEIYAQVISDFKSSIKDIVNSILNGTKDIYEYINEI